MRQCQSPALTFVVTQNSTGAFNSLCASRLWSKKKNTKMAILIIEHDRNGPVDGREEVWFLVVFFFACSFAVIMMHYAFLNCALCHEHGERFSSGVVGEVAKPIGKFCFI